MRFTVIRLENNVIGRFRFGYLAAAMISLLVLSGVPLVSASSVNIVLNPTTHHAEISSISNTKIVFEYPKNSTVSSFLNGYNYSQQLSGFIPAGTGAVDDFESTLQNYSDHVHVENMSVSVDARAIGNSTTFVVTRSENITTWVTGVFNETDGKVMADLDWKAFVVRGAFDVPLGGHEIDLNLVSSAMTQPLGEGGDASSYMGNMFGSNSIWSQPTIDFSALNSPLTNWTRNYNPTTNTTTFTKNIKTQANFSASVSFNGQEYSLSMVHDPSASISVLGYATASGNSLIVGSAPIWAILASETGAWIALIVAIGAASAYMALRWRSKKGGMAHPTPPLMNN